MAIGDDISIDTSGNFRYTGSGTAYTVLAFHRWIGDLMDDAQASGNDLLDITDETASERSTDNYVTLNSPYNIDDELAKYLYDGSIVQDGGDTIYEGIVCYAPAGTYLYLVQDGKVVSPNFWTTGLNADAGSGISHRFMVKVRTSGADIDGRRLIGLARELAETFTEFPVAPTARGNNTVALTPVTDLNNATVEATLKTYTTITNTEGLREIDVDNDGENESYYSEWNRDTYTINQLYERTKYLSRRGTEEDSNADTGTDYALNNVNAYQAQSFANGVQAHRLVRAFLRLKKTASPTGSAYVELYAHSGTYGTSSVPTGSPLATSKAIDVSKLTTSYQTIEFGFDTQYEMVASTNYVLAIFYGNGDAVNYIEVDGAAVGTHGGNQSDSGASPASWTAAAAEDLWFQIHVSPDLYGIPGEVFRGVTHQLLCDNVSGMPMTEPERISWNGGQGQLLAHEDIHSGNLTIDVVASTGTYTRSAGSFLTDGFKEGMKVTMSGHTLGTNNSQRIIDTVTATVITVTDNTGLADESGGGNENVDTTYLWLQLLTGIAPTDGQTVTGLSSGATADVDTDITERTIPLPFIGSSTGSALIGGYGVGVEYADLSTNDRAFDLIENEQRNPPNNVTFTVYGLTTDDRVLVGPEDGASGLDLDQRTLDTTLASGSTTVVVTVAIPADTPASGTIRVLDDNGIYIRAPYTSWSGSTFNLTGTFGSDATAPKNVFVSYIDKDAGSASEAFTTIYNADRTLFIRVRDGKSTPIKTAEATATLGSNGGDVTINRISDE